MIATTTTKAANISLPVVYSTFSGAVYQCDRKNRILLQFNNTLTTFKVDAFLRLKQIVDRIDLVNMASSTDRSSDLEIIYPVGCERVFVLSLPEVIALKGLLNGAKAMLELNSMLHERLSPALI